MSRQSQSIIVIVVTHELRLYNHKCNRFLLNFLLYFTIDSEFTMKTIQIASNLIRILLGLEQRTLI